jgi:transcriptional regulator with XRE-family HTH domain
MIQPIAESEETVTLRRADFETLLDSLEDAVDIAAVQAQRGKEERLGKAPARRDYLTREHVRRLSDGECPVRVWREQRGLTQAQLARSAGISQSYLAEIEAGAKPGSAHALAAVAAVLEVPMEDLVATAPVTAEQIIARIEARAIGLESKVVSMAEAQKEVEAFSVTNVRRLPQHSPEIRKIRNGLMDIESEYRSEWEKMTREGNTTAARTARRRRDIIAAAADAIVCPEIEIS